MSAISNRSFFLLVAALATLTFAGFWLISYRTQPDPLATFNGSVSKSVEEGIAREGSAEAFNKKNDQEFRDAFENFRQNGPKPPGMPN